MRCMRCRTRHYTLTLCVVKAFENDPRPVEATLCHPCIARVRAGKAVVVPQATKVASLPSEDFMAVYQ